MTTGETPPEIQPENIAPVAETDLRPTRTEALRPELLGGIGKIGTGNRDPFYVKGTYSGVNGW